MITSESYFCQICGEPKRQADIVPAQSVPEVIVRLIRRTYPAWSSGGYICLADLDRFKAQ